MGTVNYIFIKQRIKILCYVADQFLLAQRYVESSHKSLVYSLVARITRRQGLLEQSGERWAVGGFAASDPRAHTQGAAPGSDQELGDGRAWGGGGQGRGPRL